MKKIIALIAVAVLASGCATVNLNESKSYYTKANIWYESTDKILPMYHKGDILPVGTRVKVLYCCGGKVRFTTENGREFTLINAAKYTTIGLKEFFDQYFFETNVLSENGQFHAFSQTEQENIKSGSIVPGMSKEAVLMAYGYPPSHATRNISSNTWFYWKSKFRRLPVYFKDNKLTLDQPEPVVPIVEPVKAKPEPKSGNKGNIFKKEEQVK